MEMQPSFILPRIYVHALPLFVFPSPCARILIKANCPQVSLAYHSQHLGRVLKAGTAVLIFTDQCSIL